MQCANTTDSRTPIRFDADLIRRYGGRGPRYTSYPTALQFDERLGEERYCENSRLSNASGLPLSLYVHIPFCRSLCYYCGCNKVVTRNQIRVARYLDYLGREIRMQAALFDPSRRVEQLHFGGGTPTYLDARQLADLMETLDSAFGFEHSKEREYSIEVDPRTVDRARIFELAELGFNRLSLGVQDFAGRVQNAVNRIQPHGQVAALMDYARAADFHSVSLDLIYGLPHQTVTTFDKTLGQIIALQPERLAVYNYAHLPERFKGQRMIDAATLPSDTDKLDILHLTVDRLTDAGYEYVGMDHFALPHDKLVEARRDGTLQRNFQGYSTHRHCDLVGLGASSIGSIGDVYAQNATTTMQYEAMLEANRLPIVRGVELNQDDRIRRDVIQALMCFDRLDFDAIEDVYAIDLHAYFQAEFEQLVALAKDGLIEFDDRHIAVTPSGRLLVRSVAMVFDRYLHHVQAGPRFSKVI